MGAAAHAPGAQRADPVRRRNAVLIRQSGDRGGAFYEFFYPHLLHPLSEAELLRCLRKIADTRGPAGQPVRDILAREPERLRTLHTLTGGNPRVLALVYQLLERAESDTVFADLEVLLDQLTPFYKARVEDYRSDQQRAVIDAVALHWDPITSHDLAKITEIEITTVSSQLTRLKNDGLIEEVPTSGARAGYQLVERFFNIWYLMRHGTRRTRQKMYWLTAFLKSFYAPDELTRMKLKAVGAERTGWHQLYQEALFAAVESWSPLKQITIPGICMDKPSIEGQLELNVGALRAAEIEINEAAELIANMNKAAKLRALGRNEEAIMTYDDIVARFKTATEPTVQALMVGALLAKGNVLGTMGRNAEALQAYDDIVALFKTAAKPALQAVFGWALLHKGLILGTLCRNVEAIEAYDDVVTRFQTETNTLPQIMVGAALAAKVESLGALDRSDEAIAISNEVVAKLGVATEPVFRLLVGVALVNKGYHLGKLERGGEAIAVYDEVVSRFDSAPEPALREQVAQALFNKGVTTAILGDGEEAIAVYDDIVARFGSATEPVLREQIAKAFVNKGVTLAGLGRSEEAIAVWNEVKARFEAATELLLREQLALALMNKAAIINTLGRSDEAIAVWDEVVTEFSTASTSALRAAVAKALLAKGIINYTLGRSEEAIAYLNDVVAQFETASEVSIRQTIALALSVESVCLGSLARSEEALVAIRRAFEIEPDNALVSVPFGNLLADQFWKFDEAESAYLRAMRDTTTKLLRNPTWAGCISPWVASATRASCALGSKLLILSDWRFSTQRWSLQPTISAPLPNTSAPPLTAIKRPSRRTSSTTSSASSASRRRVGSARSWSPGLRKPATRSATRRFMPRSWPICAAKNFCAMSVLKCAAPPRKSSGGWSATRRLTRPIISRRANPSSAAAAAPADEITQVHGP